MVCIFSFLPSFSYILLKWHRPMTNKYLREEVLVHHCSVLMMSMLILVLLQRAMIVRNVAESARTLKTVNQMRYVEITVVRASR